MITNPKSFGDFSKEGINYDIESKSEVVKYNVELKHFLHRGATIKNSGKVFVLVLYTGKDSKIMLN